jgi:chromosome segregation ATPase
VTGQNGSGKSSVLQGLVLGLLADSKHTKRYNKLQDFIQKGHNRAIVQVESTAVEMWIIVLKLDPFL